MGGYGGIGGMGGYPSGSYWGNTGGWNAGGYQQQMYQQQMQMQEASAFASYRNQGNMMTGQAAGQNLYSQYANAGQNYAMGTGYAGMGGMGGGYYGGNAYGMGNLGANFSIGGYAGFGF